MEGLTYEEMMEELKKEYEKMIECWEKGRVFYHFRAYIKKYAKSGWVRYKSLKEPLCATLALSRKGLPITSTSLNFLIGGNSQEAYNRLKYLASYGVLEPIDVIKGKKGNVARGFKLNPNFIEYVYKSLEELGI